MHMYIYVYTCFCFLFSDGAVLASRAQNNGKWGSNPQRTVTILLQVKLQYIIKKDYAANNPLAHEAHEKLERHFETDGF